RRLTGYTQVFDGTGTDPTDRDASIKGAGYIGYKTLSSYDVDACETYCNSHSGCVFVNLYYIFNVNAQTNPVVRCAAYTQPHSGSEKTNFGGQQLLPAPAGKTYVQQSTGYALDSVSVLANPTTPAGYQLVFGPTTGANTAPGVSSYPSTTLSQYDVQGCANFCNGQAPDPVGGICQYFNIYQTISGGNPTYTCATYYLPTDASTATNTGGGAISYSRGYSRVSVVLDGGFEGYITSCNPNDLCTVDSYQYWTSTTPGSFDAVFFDYAPRARTGHGVALLGQAYDATTDPGTITPTSPLVTTAGKQYVIAFWHDSSYSGQQFETNSFLQVIWNGAIVFSITPGYQTWTFYSVTVTAQGNDVLEFTGGHAPSWDRVDDVAVFLNN
ncbi:hypothetical protein BDN72DRAFT_765850, partial [Pluteus cervinus]